MNLDRIFPVLAPLLAPLMRPRQRAREAQFAAVPRSPGRLVFLGDSITEGTEWEDWFPEFRTSNRGIAGQTVGEVMARLETALVEPRAISLLIGTNDLHGLGKSSEVGSIVAQMSELVDQIRAHSPSAPLLVNSVMPRSLHFRDRIIDLNRGYAEIASRTGATYVDLWPVLADAKGAIRRDLTSDGLHLSVPGYQAWVDTLRPHFAALTE